ncbi:aldose 1-epimerase family protein [Kribbella sp. CA-293567]|uniref:aldose 1-epimerase family protein n=1 Tax=Kribbella sp. CA-293567 TaxID=3002436 RepID=UPI0022DD05E0|nr:aldose 1-epimerase family protein [Kribbella sp. CA-293567]WBQ07288.1 aldose 1-epimerase family protein [Kribbella sp. CA-293567]
MSVLPSGEQWTVQAGEYSGTVVSVGGGLRGLSYAGREVLIGYPEDQPARAGIGQHLFPWPNRITDGKYTFQGVDQQLYLTEPARGNAIHGLTRWANWERVDDGSDESYVELAYRLHGQPGYPHQLDLTLVYQLDATDGLTVTAGATNIGAGDAPYGYGAHPYLTVGRQIDECELEFTAASWLKVTPEQFSPVGLEPVAGSKYDFGQARKLQDVEIDNAFTDLPPVWEVRLTDPATGNSARLSSDTRWMQLYTAGALDRAGLAVEPMTCPPDAFVSGDDLVVLKPGDEHTTSFRVSV